MCLNKTEIQTRANRLIELRSMGLGARNQFYFKMMIFEPNFSSWSPGSEFQFGEISPDVGGRRLQLEKNS